ncbi:MAG: hypothetical protein K2O06_17900 [Acetatifactor sp.]|nr:hypothetical protein [Acetatifactor sp.]
MKSKVWMTGICCLACFWLMLCSCSLEELLQEVPRDYAISGTAPQDSSVETEEPFSEGEGAGEEDESNGGDGMEDEISFLMPEAVRFACERLSEAERVWYYDMERLLGSFGDKVQLDNAGLEAGLEAEDVDRIFQCVLNDHPELFFVEGYSYTRYTRGERTTAIEFSGTYTMDRETAMERREEIDAAADRLLSGISPDAGDYEKVKYVYDTLIRETDYELGAPDNQNIYSVFVNHVSVCQGYAKATQYLLNRLGVECTLVLGTVDAGEGHAWNLVKVEGDYYFVDTTWGDASYRTEEGQGDADTSDFKVPEINYDYLNVTTAELLRTHTLGGEVEMPLCTQVKANYYVREKALFSAYDEEQLQELFDRALEQGRDDVTVKCADRACFDAMYTALIQEHEIFRYLPDHNGSVAYAQNEDQLSLTFWVTNE